jgi:GNAT superfamily N-acetyltransferase
VGRTGQGPPLCARALRRRDRSAALARLSAEPKLDLLLFDLVAGPSAGLATGEAAPEIVGAWRGEELVGVAALRPTLVPDARFPAEALDPLLPHIDRIEAGLVRSAAEVVGPLWKRLHERGRRALLDRMEQAYVVEAGAAGLVAPPPHVRVRPAEPGDLEELVVAARASLREEGRPDPFDGDPPGFRRWVRGRLPRARVVEHAGRVVSVGYADVRREQGWLLQGVYTRPDARRQGFATVGVSDLCRTAFAEGAKHVQLAVVEGNEAAERLYARLGFHPFARLRTILFEWVAAA